jgi:hypothetical protein
MRKAVCLPTLSDLRDMVGHALYLDLIWMWRENTQDALAAERRARLSIPASNVHAWLAPAFAPVANREVSASGQDIQVARLHAVSADRLPAIDHTKASSALLAPPTNKQPRRAASASRR